MKRSGKREGKCLNPNCDHEPRYRGLCWTCYAAARKLIKEQKLSWVDLEAAGAASPAKRPRSSARDWLLGITKEKDKK